MFVTPFQKSVGNWWLLQSSFKASFQTCFFTKTAASKSVHTWQTSQSNNINTLKD